MERSKPTSGDWLRAMIVRGCSTVTVVRSGGGPSSQFLARIQPVAVHLARLEVEARRRPVLRRAAAGKGIGATHMF
jgi:hypothetical protein